MNGLRLYRCAADKLIWLALTVQLVVSSRAAGAEDLKLDVLRTRTGVYSNVTVTTKATNYVFILHATGMASIKVADLLPEAKEQLGYLKKGGPATNSASAWAARELAKINVPKIAELKQEVSQKWHFQPPAKLSAAGLAGSKLLYAATGMALLIWLFYCYCCMLICRKAGYPPGVLVWIPALQIIPLLRAAQMSLWWILALLVPVLNIVPGILWPFKIAKARGKSIWVGVLLLLPVISLFAFLYLAFSNGGSAEEDEESESKVMSLQAI